MMRLRRQAVRARLTVTLRISEMSRGATEDVFAQRLRERDSVTYDIFSPRLAGRRMTA